MMQWLTANPFWGTVGILFFAFWLVHFVMNRVYTMGKKPTSWMGVVMGGIAIVLMIYGLREFNTYLANLLGMLAGIMWWCVYGEIGDTLQGDHDVETGIGIGSGNLPFLILLGTIGILAVVVYDCVSYSAAVQFLNSAFAIWFGHVLLLTIYYHPVFGGEAPELGTDVVCSQIWSKRRQVSAWLYLLLVALPLMILCAVYFAKSSDVRLQTGAALWFIMAFWSWIEVFKKLYKFRMW